jgi:hypothetical protein
MASKLSYFHQLEAATRLVNTPGDDVCLRPEFAPMLAKLDECLDYVQQNVRTPLDDVKCTLLCQAIDLVLFYINRSDIGTRSCIKCASGNA